VAQKSYEIWVVYSPAIAGARRAGRRCRRAGDSGGWGGSR
jgi:hypothetical protein